MASPQVEDGHTRICNELLDALCRIKMPGSHRQLFDAILRRTYGWRKKADNISIGQLAEMTGLSRRTVIYVLQNLEAGKFITVQRTDDGTANLIGIQKNHELWVVQEKGGQYRQAIEKQKERYRAKVVQETMGMVQENDGSARNDGKVVQENDANPQFLAPPKETKKKETTPPIIPPSLPEGSENLFPELPESRPPNVRDFQADAIEILRFLNQTGHTAFHESDKTLNKIIARLKSRPKDPYGVEDVKAMIRMLWNESRGTDQQKYFRPKTIFAEENFENYIGRIPKQKPPSTAAPSDPAPPPKPMTPEERVKAEENWHKWRKKCGLAPRPFPVAGSEMENTIQ